MKKSGYSIFEVEDLKDYQVPLPSSIDFKLQQRNHELLKLNILAAGLLSCSIAHFQFTPIL